jgi:hypothetical protein
MGRRIDRRGICYHCSLRILTVKRIHAEGLQQKGWAEIGIKEGGKHLG